MLESRRVSEPVEYSIPEAVLFDLDGTLLDTLRDLADSGNAVLAEEGHPVHPVEDYKTFVGNGMAHLVRAIFPEAHRPAEGPETEAMLARYRAAYAERWNRTTRLYPGIAELLDGLAGRGVPLGVLSNKAHDFTRRCVEEFLSGWEWSVVLGAREGVPRKPDPAAALEAAKRMGVAPRDCAFLGDSDVDMQTAHNAGMQAVGVSWGFRGVEELRAAGAQRILDAPEELFVDLRGGQRSQHGGRR